MPQKTWCKPRGGGGRADELQLFFDPLDNVKSLSSSSSSQSAAETPVKTTTKKLYYVILNFEKLVMCLLPALIYFQLPLSICFSSSSTAPKSSGASETWAGIKEKKKSGRGRSQQTKLWDVFQFFIISLWEVDIGIWAHQALFQNRQTAGMPPSAPVPAFLALWFSSHSFFFLGFYCWGLANYAQKL